MEPYSHTDRLGAEKLIQWLECHMMKKRKESFLEPSNRSLVKLMRPRKGPSTW